VAIFAGCPLTRQRPGRPSISCSRWSRSGYRSPDGDFAVIDALAPDGDDVVATGAIGHVHEGETIEVRGAWRDHPATDCSCSSPMWRLREPAGERALLGYLTQIKHVGRAEPDTCSPPRRGGAGR